MVSMVSPGATVTAVPPSQVQLALGAGAGAGLGATTDPVTSAVATVVGRGP
jgi:hypothetical protein